MKRGGTYNDRNIGVLQNQSCNVLASNINRNYSVYVYFEDGKIICYDMSQMIEKEVFYPLMDINVFKDICTVMNDTLARDIGGNRDK